MRKNRIGGNQRAHVEFDKNRHDKNMGLGKFSYIRHYAKIIHKTIQKMPLNYYL